MFNMKTFVCMSGFPLSAPEDFAPDSLLPEKCVHGIFLFFFPVPFFFQEAEPLLSSVWEFIILLE